MNFSQLKYIIAVEKYRSFSRAAEECDVAQSTLSKEIQRLEQEFDIIIFDRSRLPIIPTLKGLDLIKQTKIIIEEQRKFIFLAEKRDNLPVGEFALGITPSLAPYLLPLFINKMKNYPQLKVEILELTVKEMQHQFEAGVLDGAIGIAPFISGFYEEKLFNERFVLYVSPSHSLYEKPEIRWSDIPFNELLLHQTFKNYLHFSNELLKQGIFDHHSLDNIKYQSGSLETIRKIIDRNGGITILPQLSTLYMGARRIKMVRPIVDPILTRTVIFITPRGFEKKRVTKVIKKAVSEGLPQ